MNNKENKASSYYQWVAGGLLSVVLVLVSAAFGHWITTFTVLTEQDIVKIIHREAITDSKLRLILREEIKLSFTDLSTSRGMYVIEGRPRIETLESAIQNLNNSMNRIENKLDEINDAN
jgi:hypothetical protein